MRELTPWNYYEITLLALCLWREARGECADAKLAVGHTVLNRAQHPAWWGNDIVSVLTKKWQYSSLTDPKDPQLTNWPPATDHVFEECLTLASHIVLGITNSPLPGIDSYYDDSLQGDAIPKWAREHPERYVGKIGRLSFFNMDCDTEEPHVVLKESEA